MSYVNPDALVSTDWLADHLDEPSIRVIDATHFAPAVDRDARFEHEMRHIPGAVWFDIDDICRECSPLPHMLPPPEFLAEKAGALGLGNRHRLVVYDALGGCCAAARVWWMFRIYGHDDVAVLDGGLLKWIREKRPMVEGWETPEPEAFAVDLDPAPIRTWRHILQNIDSRQEQVVDARAAARFKGEAEEVYRTKHLGHIPGSVNLPFTQLLENYKRDYVMKSADEIRVQFDSAGIDLSRPIATTCGTGVTACIPLLALHLIGIESGAMYDGSWNEWGNRDDLPHER